MKKHSFGSRLFLGLVLLVLYLPIVVVVIYSFNDNSARIPLAFTGWTTRWYGELLEGKGGYGPALLLSLRVALWSVLLSVVIGSLGAVGMTRSALGFWGKPGRFDRFMEAFSILPIMIPEIVLGLAFMVIFNALGVRDNVARLVLAHTTFCIPTCSCRSKAGWWAWISPCSTRPGIWARRPPGAVGHYPAPVPPGHPERRVSGAGHEPGRFRHQLLRLRRGRGHAAPENLFQCEGGGQPPGQRAVFADDRRRISGRGDPAVRTGRAEGKGKTSGGIVTSASRIWREIHLCDLRALPVIE
ncbi:MAG: ABC transporter permease [Lachnospiraceae bacterium]